MQVVHVQRMSAPVMVVLALAAAEGSTGPATLARPPSRPPAHVRPSPHRGLAPLLLLRQRLKVRQPRRERRQLLAQPSDGGVLLAQHRLDLALNQLQLLTVPRLRLLELQSADAQGGRARRGELRVRAALGAAVLPQPR